MDTSITSLLLKNDAYEASLKVLASNVPWPVWVFLFGMLAVSALSIVLWFSHTEDEYQNIRGYWHELEKELRKGQ